MFVNRTIDDGSWSRMLDARRKSVWPMLENIL